MTIGRVIDYIEARLEAIKSREEEEDEDEERDKERERRPPSSATSKTQSGVASGSKFPGPVGTSKVREFVSAHFSSYQSFSMILNTVD